MDERDGKSRSFLLHQERKKIEDCTVFSYMYFDFHTIVFIYPSRGTGREERFGERNDGIFFA